MKQQFITQPILATLTVMTLALMPTTPAHAVGSSGFENAVLSTSSLAKGNAVTANPTDASTIAFNPAGLTEVGNEVYIGSSFALPAFHHQSTEGRGSEDSSKSVYALPYFYVSLELPIEDWDLGVGVNSPFGAVSKWDSDGLFKRTASYTELKTVAYNLSLAHKVSDKFSVGGGWTLMDIRQKQTGKFNQDLVAGSTQDAPYELDIKGHGQGWNLGFLYKATDKDTLGFFYRNEVRTHVKGVMSTHGLTGGLATVFATGAVNVTSADTDVSLPASANIGWNHQFNDRFQYEVDLTFTGWSSYDGGDIDYGTSNAVLVGFEQIQRDFNDTWGIHTGGSYKLDENWMLDAGYYFQEMAANKNTYQNDVPDGDRHGFTLGFEFKNKAWTWDLNYLASLITKQKIENITGNPNITDIDGEYSGLTHVWSTGLRRDF